MPSLFLLYNLAAGVVSSCAEEAQGLVIPVDTTVIESEAFAGCENVHVLTVLGQDAEIADDALDVIEKVVSLPALVRLVLAIFLPLSS